MLFSLRIKLTIFTIMLIALVGSIVMAATAAIMRDTLSGEIKEKGIAIAKSVAHSSEDALVGEGDELFLFQFITSAMKNRGVAYALIVDNDNVIRAHSDTQRSLEKYVPPQGGQPEKGDGYSIRSVKDNSGQDVFDIAVPVRLTGSEKTVLGTVHLGLSSKAIDEPVSKLQQVAALIALGGLLLGGLGAFTLAVVTVAPIKLLVKGANEIGKGNLDQKIAVRSRDEIGELTVAFNDMAKGLREKAFIRDTFERYMSKQLAEKLLEGEGRMKLELGGEHRFVTVLFTDIRGFTSMSERLDPKSVISFLNDYFSMMVDVVFSNKGWIDKFIGDALMVIYGVPVRRDDDAFRAVRTGLMMQAALRTFNERRAGKGIPAIHMGIGISSGTVIAGNVGSEERMNYTVIGDAVNLAARLEPLSLQENVIISHDTYELVKDRFVIEKKGEVLLKGKLEPQQVYEVIKEL